jgi:hypothetical protein
MPLSDHSMLVKDRRNAKADVLQHRHFAVIAGVIAKLDPTIRLATAKHFANELSATNPRFDRTRFLRACNVIS